MFKLSIFIILLYCAYLSSTEFQPKDIPLCQRKNSSCGYGFGELENNFCSMIYYEINNKNVCNSVYDAHVTKYSNVDLGKLILVPFEGDLRTVFNVTFVNNKWKKLLIRFEENERSEKCMVKEFILNDTVSPDKSFSYVCPWSDASFEGRVVDFYYKYGTVKYETEKKIKFIVPLHEDLRKSKRIKAISDEIFFFMYVDYTDLYNLTLKIVPSQHDFNVSQYKIEVIYLYKQEKYVKAHAILNAIKNSNVLEYSYYTYGNVGSYYFVVEPVSSICKGNKKLCRIHITPQIIITYENSFLLIGMVGVSFLIPVFMIIIYMWTKKWPGLLKLRAKPNILLVTFPTNNAHAIVAPVFAEFLKTTYNVNVILDINEVSQTKAKNSYEWLKGAIKYATHIVFLCSNDGLSHNRVIYKDMYLRTIHLLDPKLSDKKEECIVLFPYSKEVTDRSNPELIHIKNNRFEFTKDKHFDKFITFLTAENVPRTMRENDSYKLLLKAIKCVENEEFNNENQQIEFNVISNISDDESVEFSPQNIKYCSEENNDVKINLDFENMNLMGDPILENEHSSNESDSDSDLDINYFGNDGENLKTV